MIRKRNAVLRLLFDTSFQICNCVLRCVLKFCILLLSAFNNVYYRLDKDIKVIENK